MEEIKCPVCGLMFRPKKRSQRYCSLKCVNARSKNNPNYKTCAECGALFTAPNREQRFCSRACAIANRPKARQEKLESGSFKCAYCGKEFQAKSHAQRFCCKECQDKNWEEKKKRKDMALKRRCHDCGKPTIDYRCDGCLRKWRDRHGITQNEEWLTTYSWGSA